MYFTFSEKLVNSNSNYTDCDVEWGKFLCILNNKYCNLQFEDGKEGIWNPQLLYSTSYTWTSLKMIKGVYGIHSCYTVHNIYGQI